MEQILQEQDNHDSDYESSDLEHRSDYLSDNVVDYVCESILSIICNLSSLSLKAAGASCHYYHSISC